MPPYGAVRESGLDTCGLAQLASRTVGVPFAGLIAATLAIFNLISSDRNEHIALRMISGEAKVADRAMHKEQLL
ncbi:hypothetical protein ABIA99_006033 [Bradyrhizobium sp. LB12.1]|uniref:hypothetical protein n=1 Tax=Bradyrhizobium sp. LB12.1 TaxID=3156327 RepID=UPI003397B5BC